MHLTLFNKMIPVKGKLCVFFIFQRSWKSSLCPNNEARSPNAMPTMGTNCVQMQIPSDKNEGYCGLSETAKRK